MKFSKNQLFAFLFGLGATISIRVVGIFALSDLFAVLMVPFLIYKNNMYVDKRFRTTILLLILWMTSTLVSDIYNQTSLINAIKGFFTLIPFLGCLLFAYWLLIKDYKLMIPFVWGYSISFVISAGFGVDANFQESLAREGLTSVTQLVHYSKIIVWISSSFITGALAISYFKKYPWLITLIMFIFSFFPLIEGTRSTFVLIFLVSIIIFYVLYRTKYLPWDGILWQDIFRSKIPRFVFIILILIFAAKNIYEYSASKGYLGENEKYKYEMQKNTKIGLLAGRSEFIASLLAIKDSPVLGHGSYAIDKNHYGLKAVSIVGYNSDIIGLYWNHRGEKYIPTHSHLWQAWVYNGILGGIFWIFILFGILLKFTWKYLFYYPKYFAYILSSLTVLTWNILFSPFSQKTLLATSICFFIILMNNVDNETIDETEDDF